MPQNFLNNYQDSEFVQDTTETSTLPVTNEYFTEAHVEQLASEIVGTKYALGMPGLRGSASPIWGTNIALNGTAVSSLTSVVFSATQTAITVGSLICGSSPTSTGFRRVTAYSNLTATVDSAFTVDLNSETAYVHGTLAERLATIESDISSLSTTASQPSGHIYGLTLSNNTTDPTNDIDIATGEAVDNTTGTKMILSSGLTKQLDAAWAVGTNAGGLDTGAIANTTYHVFLIKRSDTGVVDALFSTSATSPTMPTNYDYKRRIGSIIRSGATILGFTQDGDHFDFDDVINDISATNPGTSRVTATISVPTGIIVYAKLLATIRAVTETHAAIRPLTETDAAVTAYTDETFDSPSWDIYGANAGSKMIPVYKHVRTNTSAQVAYRLGYSDASSVFHITTVGWIDRRDK